MAFDDGSVGSDRDLHRSLDRLWAALNAESNVLSEARWRALLAEEVADLAAAVDSHFAREETGGYFAESIARMPSLSNRADELLAEHAQVRRQLAELTTIPTGAGAGYRKSLRDLVALLRRHEHDEEALMQEAVLRDFGAGD